MAFHSYPHLIRKLFNAYRCGPPSGVTRTSSWTRVDHSVSRLPRPTCALLRLAFATAAGVVPLNLAGHGNSQVHYAKGTPSHLRAPTACRRTVSGSFSLPCSGCFSPFPHGTGSLSVSREYLALPDGPGGFTRDSSCPALLRIPPPTGKAARKGLSPATAGRSRPFRSPSTFGPWRSYNPGGAETPTVWAVPLPLAATRGITLVFFSCGY